MRKHLSRAGVNLRTTERILLWVDWIFGENSYRHSERIKESPGRKCRRREVKGEGEE